MTLGEGSTHGRGGGDQDSGREGDGLWVRTPSPCLLPRIIACSQGRACVCHILDFIPFSEFGLCWRDPGPEARDESRCHHSLPCILRQRPPPLWASSSSYGRWRQYQSLLQRVGVREVLCAQRPCWDRRALTGELGHRRQKKVYPFVPLEIFTMFMCYLLKKHF